MTTKQKLIPISEVKKMIEEEKKNMCLNNCPRCRGKIEGFFILNQKLDAWVNTENGVKEKQ